MERYGFSSQCLNMLSLSIVAVLFMLCGSSKLTLPDPEKLLGKSVQATPEHLFKLRQHYQMLNDHQVSLNKGEVPLSWEEAKKKLLENKTEMHHDDARFYLFQGDLLLTVEQVQNLAESHLSRGIQTVPQSFWDPKVPIPYFFDPSLSTAALTSIPQAISFWQDNSCINFTYSTTQPQRLRFFAGVGCYSLIGKQYQQDSQDVSIGSGCEGFGTVTHEIAHALGFFHEQSRPGRDQYLTIDFSNIISGLEYNFVENTAQEDDTYGLPFDYGYVMQYDAYAFAVDTSVPTVVATDARYQSILGQRYSPSFADVRTLNMAYCTGNCASTSTVCHNNGYPNLRDCSTCICPVYFGGNDCSQLAVGNAPVCNGGSWQAHSDWQNLTGKAGMNNYSTTDTPVDCFWQITAPDNTSVELRLLSPLAQCSPTCVWQGLDINLGAFDQSGFLVCCNTNATIWTTTRNVAVIRGMSRYNIASFVIQFKYQ